jgi:hypothetical protein
MKNALPLLWLLVGLFGACGPENKLFLRHALHTSKPIVFQVGYVFGVELPLATLVGEGGAARRITVREFVCNNVQALLSERECLFPEKLSEMQPLIPVSHNGYYTQHQIVAMTRQLPGAPTDARIVILNGRLAPKEITWCPTKKSCIMGLTTRVWGQPDVIAVFLPVLTDLVARNTDGFDKQLLAFYLFGDLIVHETGHLLGLVRGGVAAITEHEDPRGPRNHCGNPQCVMKEGRNSYQSVRVWGRVRAKQGASADIVFGKECLWDVWSAVGH